MKEQSHGSTQAVGSLIITYGGLWAYLFDAVGDQVAQQHEGGHLRAVAQA